MTPALNVSEAEFVRDYFASVEPLYGQADLGYANFLLCMDGTAKFLHAVHTQAGGPYTWSFITATHVASVCTNVEDAPASRQEMLGKRARVRCHDHGSEPMGLRLEFDVYGTFVGCYEDLVTYTDRFQYT